MLVGVYMHECLSVCPCKSVQASSYVGIEFSSAHSDFISSLLKEFMDRYFLLDLTHKVSPLLLLTTCLLSLSTTVALS